MVAEVRRRFKQKLYDLFLVLSATAVFQVKGYGCML